MQRRKFLCAIGATGALSGCLTSNADDPYTLVLQNSHDLPHLVKLRIEAYAENADSDPTTETAQLTLEAGATKRLEPFDREMDYSITASLPDQPAITVPYGREGVAKDGRFVTVTIEESGRLNGGVRKP